MRTSYFLKFRPDIVIKTKALNFVKHANKDSKENITLIYLKFANRSIKNFYGELL